MPERPQIGLLGIQGGVPKTALRQTVDKPLSLALKLMRVSSWVGVPQKLQRDRSSWIPNVPDQEFLLSDEAPTSCGT